MKYTILAILFLSVTLFGGCWNNRWSVGKGVCAVVDGPIEVVDKGPSVFQAKCAICHHLHKNTTGPALSGVLDRAPYPTWFQEFVRNQDSLINLGEPYREEVMNWSVVRHQHNYNEITDDEMHQLEEYVSN